MRVKRTKNGSFNAELTFIDRKNISNAMCDFLESHQHQIHNIRLMNEADVMKQMYYSIINQLFIKKSIGDFSPETIKWKLTRAEAIALMWLLRTHDNNMSLLELKSVLHKQLHSI